MSKKYRVTFLNGTSDVVDADMPVLFRGSRENDFNVSIMDRCHPIREDLSYKIFFNNRWETINACELVTKDVDVSFIVHLTLTGVEPDTVWDGMWLRSNLESLLIGLGVKADVSVVKMLNGKGDS